MNFKLCLLFFVIFSFKFVKCEGEIESPFKENQQPIELLLTDIIYPEYEQVYCDSALNKEVVFKMPLEKELLKHELGKIIVFDYAILKEGYVENSLNYNQNDKLYNFRLNNENDTVLAHQMYNCNYGEPYVILWVNDQNGYIFSNAFWGELIKYNNSNSNLILFGPFGGEGSIQTLKIIDLKNNKISQRIQYTSLLSIPEKTRILNKLKFLNTQNNCALRAWPEIVNKGLFNEASQSVSNGNIEEIYEDNVIGFAYAEYLSTDNIIWLLVKLKSPKKSLTEYFYLNSDIDYYFGWVKEDEIEYK